MFRRRTPLPLLGRIASSLWPKGGWRRSTTYLAHRVRRLPETPYRIAAGFACGAAMSFTPFIGFHFAGAALIALLIRANVVASAIGTVVGNPWTFPIIWAWIYGLGTWLTGEKALTDLPRVLSLAYIFEHPLNVLWPMTVGGIPTAIVAWFAFYLPIHGAVVEYQRARRWRIRRRAKRRRGHPTRIGLEELAMDEMAKEEQAKEDK
jgi:uncharacterized protein (DUF2062 family)